METLKHMKKLEDHCQFEMHLSQARIKFRTAITSSNQSWEVQVNICIYLRARLLAKRIIVSPSGS